MENTTNAPAPAAEDSAAPAGDSSDDPGHSPGRGTARLRAAVTPDLRRGAVRQ